MEEDINKIKQSIKDIGLMPIEVNTKNFLIIDLYYLAKDYYEEGSKNLKEKLEKELGIKIIFIDTMKHNIGIHTAKYPPIYLI